MMVCVCVCVCGQDGNVCRAEGVCVRKKNTCMNVKYNITVCERKGEREKICSECLM